MKQQQQQQYHLTATLTRNDHWNVPLMFYVFYCKTTTTIKLNRFRLNEIMKVRCQKFKKIINYISFYIFVLLLFFLNQFSEHNNNNKTETKLFARKLLSSTKWQNVYWMFEHILYGVLKCNINCRAPYHYHYISLLLLYWDAKK